MKKSFHRACYGLTLALILGLSPSFLSAQESLGEDSVESSGIISIETDKLKNTNKNNKPRHAFAKLVKANDPMIRHLELLFAELGIAPPAQVYPISFEEIRFIMKEHLERDKLSSLGKSLYDLVWAKTEKPSTWGVRDWVAIDPVLGITAEFYTGFKSKYPRDWYLYSFKDRPAFVDLGAEVSLFDMVYINTTAHIKQDQTWIDWTPNSITGNIITNFSSIYAMMPQDAYGSLAIPHFNIQGGRGILNWGNGKSGNLLLSDSAGELDYLQVATWWKFIKFTSLWVFLDSSAPMRDLAGDIVYYDAGGKKYAFAIDPKVQAELGVQPSQFFLAHRLDFKMGERMNFSLTEAVIYKDYWQNAAFLNPFYAFHNWYLTGHADYFFSIDAEIALTKRWTIYTQMLLDQVSAGLNRLSDSAQAYPGSIPFLIGTEVVTPMTRGYVSWVFEFVKIDPYSYLDRSDVGLFLDKRWLSSYAGAHYGENGYALIDRVPLGYYLGNDLLRFFTQIRYEIPDFYSLWTEHSVLLKGANTIDTQWSSAPGEALKHAPSNLHYIQIANNFGGQISFARWIKGQKLSFKGDVTFINTIYKKDVSLDIQVGLGLAYAY